MSKALEDYGKQLDIRKMVMDSYSDIQKEKK